MTRYKVAVTTLLVLCIIEAGAVAFTTNGWMTWRRLALGTHEIAAVCVVDTRGDLDRLFARFSQSIRGVALPPQPGP